MATEEAGAVAVLGGTAIGAAVGGPLGAAAGASIGSAVSSVLGGGKARRKARRASRQRAAYLRREADVERERSRRLVGEQRAGFGAAGVDPNVGSPLEVQVQTMQDSFLNQERILAGAGLSQQEGYLQADLARSQGIGMGIDSFTQALLSLYDSRKA